MPALFRLLLVLPWLTAVLPALAGDDLATRQRAAQDKRDRLEAERRQAEVKYAQAETACRTQILENDCINAAREQRILVVERVRAELRALNQEARELRRLEVEQKRKSMLDQRAQQGVPPLRVEQEK